MKNVPFLYFRYYNCTEENGIKPNVVSGTKRKIAIIIVAEYIDETSINCNWMGDEHLYIGDSNDGFVTIPSLDIMAEKIVIDDDDAAEVERKAFQLMKELWAKVEVE